MKKIKRAFRIVSACLAFLLITTVIFGFMLLEPAVNIKGFPRLSPTSLGAEDKTNTSGSNTNGNFGYDNGIDGNNSNTNSIGTYKDIAGKRLAGGTEFFGGMGESGGLLPSSKLFVPINSLKQHTIDAFVCTEDERFFQHAGIDYYRILGASATNLREGRFKEGASTITQQLIKNTHLSSDKSLKRKIAELRLATAVERKYGKNKILELYLNAIYFGNGAVGIGAAARTYFGKDAGELTAGESALLAGVINNPARFSPYSHPDRCEVRRQLVLSRMLKNKRISATDYEQLSQEKVMVEPKESFSQYAYFLTNEGCESLGLTRAEFLAGGFKIHTYMDSVLQSSIEGLINNYGFNGRENAIIHVVVMTADGDILANAATSQNSLAGYYRQPGSVIKPAISYAPAFEKRLIVPLTPILDEPVNYGGYAPQNYKHNMGWVSASDALKHSQNIPAVKLLDMCGVEYSRTVAERLGYEFAADDCHLALALGGMSRGATLTQIAGSYQAFANEGILIKPAQISAITDSRGRTVYKRSKRPTRAVSPETAYFIGEILSECAREGTAKRINIASPESTYVPHSENIFNTIAAKTGTVGNENGNSDAYTVAYNGGFVVAVHISSAEGLLPNTITGATHPCIIARKILELLPASYTYPPHDNLLIKKPNSVVTLDLDKNEYRKNHKLVLASRDTPKKDRLSGSFISDNTPKSAFKNNFILQMNHNLFSDNSDAYAKHSNQYLQNNTYLCQTQY